MDKIEQIKAEVERLRVEYNILTERNRYRNEQAHQYYGAKRDCLTQLLSFIDSLQDEPKDPFKILAEKCWIDETLAPEDFKPVDIVNECVFNIPDEPCKDCNTCIGDSLAYDTEVWNWLREHGTEETKQIIMMTARHFVDWQRELDEKEFEDYLDNVEGQPRVWHSDEQMEWAKDIARHFFELGRNARKEE